MEKILWASDGGEIICESHAGMYLTCAIEARPKAKSHTTPLGRWVKVTDADKAAWPADLGPMDCETCRFGI